MSVTAARCSVATIAARSQFNSVSHDCHTLLHRVSPPPTLGAQLRNRLIACLRDPARAADLTSLLPHCGRVGLIAVLASFDGPVPDKQAIDVLDRAAQPK